MAERNEGIQINGSGQLTANILVVGRNAKAIASDSSPHEESSQAEISSPLSPASIDAVATPHRRLIIYLHGLGGDAEKTWGKLPDLVSSVLPQSCEVFKFTYPTTIFGMLFSHAPRIQELAAGLRTQINSRFPGNFSIDFICHSLGGLVARYYILDEIKSNRPLRVERLALVSVPNNGSDLASFAHILNWRNKQIGQLRKNSDIIDLLNEDWVRFDVSKKIKSMYVVGSNDSVVDKLSAQHFWGNEFTETILGKGHTDIIKPVRLDDDIVTTLRRFLS